MDQPGVEGLRIGDPERIGPYRLLGRLGEGGMGTVYLAQAPTGRPVAVKVVKAEFAIEEGFASRFHAEVENARRVASFCTAQVLDNGNADDGRPYMVTEYIAGTPLSRQIFQHGALEPGPLHGVALGVAAALAAIHVAGLVHRDLKPANVILSLSGPRVIDFGIARALDSTSGFTKSGEVLGSPGWWAPEQVRGQEITPAADVFAWGCLVAYAGNGRHPYGRGNMITMASRLLNGPPDLGALPAPLNDLARLATSMDPYQRPTAQDLLIALVGGGIAAPAPAAAPPVDPPTLVATDALAESWQAPPNVESDATLTLSVLDLQVPAAPAPAEPSTVPGAATDPSVPPAHTAPTDPRVPTGAAGPATATPPGPAGPAGAVPPGAAGPTGAVPPGAAGPTGPTGPATAAPPRPATTPSATPGPAATVPSAAPGPAAASGRASFSASSATSAVPAAPAGPAIPAEPPGRSGRTGTPRWRWVLAGLAVVAALAVTGAVLANVVGGGRSPAAPSASGGADAGADVGRRITLGAAIGGPQLIVPVAPSCNLASYRGTAPARGRFCAVRWTLLNTGGDEVRLSRTPLVLVDDRGSAHTPEPVSSGPPSVLAPGGRADGVLVYDLPPARGPLKLTGPVVEGGEDIEVRLS